MSFYIEVKGECIHCDGTARCSPCDGAGHDADGECEECDGTGICAECVDGQEHWLMYPAEMAQDGPIVRPAVNGKRGSCLRHIEAIRFMDSGELPSWYKPYHGLA